MTYRWFILRLPLAGFFVCTLLRGIAVAAPPPSDLSALSSSFEELSRQVYPSIVRVSAVGYRQLESDETEEQGIAARQQSSGSGVIIDAAGYIVTNAHVVIGAQRVQVMLPSLHYPEGHPRKSAVRPLGRIVRADVVGLDIETDVALLKIKDPDLTPMKLADSDAVQQGQIVLAFGSPMGLDNSVTMGVVSAPARQLKPDDPMIYIQTDAPINPGNSGGPLVDTKGNVVGINTLILSQSGGSEGIGFAVPANIVSNVVEQLIKSGRVLRGEIGVSAQSITPALASGWKLPQDWGVVIGDVEPDGPADRAGLQVGDVIISLNGKVMENARQFNVNLYRPTVGQMVSLEIQRGKKRLTVAVRVEERNDDILAFAELSSKEENLVSDLGIFAVDLTQHMREQVSSLRQEKGGVLVASKSADGPPLDDGFKSGDVIYSINHQPVSSVKELRAMLKKMTSGEPVAVQIERAGKLRFIAFELP